MSVSLTRVLPRVLHRVGSHHAAVLLTGGLLATGSAVAALLGQPALAAAAIGLAVPCLLLPIWHRLSTLQRVTADMTKRLRTQEQSVRRWVRTEVRTEVRAQQGAIEQAQRVLLDALERTQQLSHKQLRKRQQEQTQQVEALLQLFTRVEPRAPMPSSGLTALNPAELLELWHLIERTRPGLVLELGSGTSTVWIGYALAKYGGRLVSVDHDPGYAQHTRENVHRHHLELTVEVRDAPLTPVTVAGDVFEWYDEKAIADLAGVDLLVVDGPPGVTGPLARLPAVPVLLPRLSDRTTVVLDDARRPDEQAILARWMKAVPGLAQEATTFGRTAVLTYTR